MGFLSALGFKGIAMIVLITALGSWAGYKHYQVTQAEERAAAAEVERDAAAVARDLAIKASTANLATIKELQNERDSIQLALNNLEADRRKNQAIIGNLSAAIRSTASDPANQVQLSPVLKATVEEIQKRRKERAQ